MKKLTALVLVFLLVLSLGVTALADPVVIKAQPVEKTDVEKQLDLIFDNLSALSQDSADGLWSYAVTDLDHNGNLELVAGICKNPDYKTYAKIYEVTPERDAFVECDMSVKEGEPFVDILQDSADTYYDKAKDTWYYLFCEDYLSSDSEFYSVKCSVSLKDGYVTPKAYAKEHTEVINGIIAVAFEDLDGNLLTPEEFNKAGTEAFKGFEKSGTNFGWFNLKDVESVTALSDSYKIFTGEKEVTHTKKNVQNEQKKDSPFLMITKNPTSETCYPGDTVYFVANANNATSYTWYFCAPNGGEYTLRDFQNKFSRSSISGGNSPTLAIQNVVEDMNKWGAYCVCEGNGQTANTSTAYVTVLSKKDGGSISGKVSDFLMSSVTIYLNNGKSVQVLKDICNVIGGSLDYGCPCTCYYSGSAPSESSIYRVDIQGKADPVWNSTSGTYDASGTDGYAVAIYVPMVGTTLYVSPSIVNYYGTAYNGCPCTVYFTGYVPSGNSDGSIYSVEVIGTAPAPVDDYTWTCNLCGTWNKESQDHCSACGASRYAEYTWTCDSCGAWNEENDSYCRACGAYRYYEPEPEYTWTCNFCNTWNEDDDYYCRSCGAYRYDEPTPDYTWTCNFCDTWNEEDVYYCRSCGAYRYDEPYYEPEPEPYNEPEPETYSESVPDTEPEPPAAD